MGYHANVAAALLLVQRIMPLIWERRPDVRVALAGGKPSRAVRALGQDARVTVTGYVPDLRPFIAGATIAVSPTPYGFGIQNKVIEALALGTPVVATSSSIGGLGPIPDDVALVADAPADFAAAVLELLDDPTRREQMSARGRKYVESHFQWGTAAQLLVAVHKAAIAAFAQRRSSTPAPTTSGPPTTSM
jgi:glycosyltransferase involved in cell wall biosynthesis